MATEVASLHIYPLKGGAAIDLAQTDFTEMGLRYDREWMLVNHRGVPLTQRQHPELAVIQSRIGSQAIEMYAPGSGSVELPLDRNEFAGNEIMPVSVFDLPGSGVDQGNEATKLFSRFIGMPVQLLRVHQSRHIPAEFVTDAMREAGVSELTGFADGFSMLLASEASLRDLNSYLPGDITIGNDRFRPNIVARGRHLQSYEEDYWRELCIGNLRAFVAKACARCPVPNVNQRNGSMPRRGESRPVTEALRTSRSGIQNVLKRNKITGLYEPVEKSGEFYGQNLAHVFDEGLVVKVGDKINVLERADEPNVSVCPDITEVTEDDSLSELLPRQERLRRHQALESA